MHLSQCRSRPLTWSFFKTLRFKMNVLGSWRLVDKRIVAIAGHQRNFALIGFFALVGPTDPLGFLEPGFLGTSFSIRNSSAHFGQLRRDIRSLSMIVPMTRGVRQCGQETYSSR